MPMSESAHIIPEKVHGIRPESISLSARKVIERLQNAGHRAYAVGGCVRDLLLGFQPKDFDVATSATPEEVRRLFRNSRLICRRISLAHNSFGLELILISSLCGVCT